jgi:hypothetical protein
MRQRRFSTTTPLTPARYNSLSCLNHKVHEEAAKSSAFFVFFVFQSPHLTDGIGVASSFSTQRFVFAHEKGLR